MNFTSMTIGPAVSESCGFQSGYIVIELCETLPRHQDITVYTLVLGLSSGFDC